MCLGGHIVFYLFLLHIITLYPIHLFIILYPIHSSYHLSIIQHVYHPSFIIYHYPIIYPILYPSFDDTPNGNRPRDSSPLTHHRLPMLVLFTMTAVVPSLLTHANKDAVSKFKDELFGGEHLVVST
eukprot:480201_1